MSKITWSWWLATYCSQRNCWFWKPTSVTYSNVSKFSNALNFVILYNDEILAHIKFSDFMLFQSTSHIFCRFKEPKMLKPLNLVYCLIYALTRGWIIPSRWKGSQGLRHSIFKTILLSDALLPILIIYGGLYKCYPVIHFDFSKTLRHYKF